MPKTKANNNTNKSRTTMTVCELRILARKHNISITKWAGKNKYVYKDKSELIDDLKSQKVRIT